MIETIQLLPYIIFIIGSIFLIKFSKNKYLNFVLISLGLIFIVIETILILPVEKEIKTSLIGFMAAGLTALFALSSTNIVKNLMNGFYLKLIKAYKIGDMLIINNERGIVHKFGLLHTVIQNENKNFIFIGNKDLAENTFKVIHREETFLSVTISLGYDVNEEKVKTFITEACLENNFEQPFVNIKKLCNFSVSYEVKVLLKEPKYYLTNKSDLLGLIKSTLESNKIEIVSPTFMNQRVFDKKDSFMVRQRNGKTINSTIKQEDIIYEESTISLTETKIKERIESLKEERSQLKKIQKEKLSKSDKDKKYKSLKEEKDMYSLQLKKEKGQNKQFVMTKLSECEEEILKLSTMETKDEFDHKISETDLKIKELKELIQKDNNDRE